MYLCRHKTPENKIMFEAIEFQLVTAAEVEGDHKKKIRFKKISSDLK